MPVLEQYSEEACPGLAAKTAKRPWKRWNAEMSAHSVCMMQHGMVGDMLRNIGRMENEKTRPGYASNVLASLAKEEQKYLAAQDFDPADRARKDADHLPRAGDSGKSGKGRCLILCSVQTACGRPCA